MQGCPASRYTTKPSKISKPHALLIGGQHVAPFVVWWPGGCHRREPSPLFPMTHAVHVSRYYFPGSRPGNPTLPAPRSTPLAPPTWRSPSPCPPTFQLSPRPATALTAPSIAVKVPWNPRRPPRVATSTRGPYEEYYTVDAWPGGQTTKRGSWAVTVPRVTMVRLK